jgi:hypothetical protein
MVELALVVVALANTVLGDVDQKHDWLVGAPQSPVALTVSNDANVTSLTLGNGLVSASKRPATMSTGCTHCSSYHLYVHAVTALAWHMACMYPSACLRSEVVQLRFRPLQAHLRWPDTAMVSHVHFRPSMHAGQTRPWSATSASELIERFGLSCLIMQSSLLTPHHSSYWTDAHHDLLLASCVFAPQHDSISLSQRPLPTLGLLYTV